MTFDRPHKPFVSNFSVEGGDSVTTTFDGTAVFSQITYHAGGEGASPYVWVSLDDSDPFALYAGDIQSFSRGDLHLTSITVGNTISGASVEADITIIAGVVA